VGRWLTLGAVLGAWGVMSACAPPPGKIVYAEAPDPEAKSGTHPLTLDLATPSEPGPHPALVFVHGGGWNFGHLSDHGYPEKLQEAARRGYVAVSLSYRLTDEDAKDGGPRFPWPAQSEDVRCAIRWLKANAAKYGVDPARIGMAGHSAGGHLSLMTALAPQVTAFDGDWCPYPGDATVAAVVSYAGPGDLAALHSSTEWWIKPLVTRFLNLEDGTTPEQAPEVYASASPLSYVESAPRDVPILLLQGLKDPIAPPPLARDLLGALLAHGRTAALFEFKDTDHALEGTKESDQADERMWAWFGRHLQGT
jgi:acetyl esterase/lipase